MTADLLVIAKQPVPGEVKTRLCPPCTPEQAAAVAAAALSDTLDVGTRSGVRHRTLVVRGVYDPPDGWSVVAQRGNGLGQRLANAFMDTLVGGSRYDPDPIRPALLIGMDTPQVTPELLGALCQLLAGADAVLGPAVDGGWWALGLRDRRAARVLESVPMSTPDTGWLTLDALRRLGMRVAHGPVLRDVDTVEDAREVARAHPGGRFAAAVAEHIPASATVSDQSLAAGA